MTVATAAIISSPTQTATAIAIMTVLSEPLPETKRSLSLYNVLYCCSNRLKWNWTRII